MRINFDTLLCSIDFSEFSHQVIRYGKDLSRQIGARLVVFHSVPAPVNRFQGASVFQETEDRRKVARRTLEKITHLMEPTDLPYKPVVAFGDPVAEVERAADAEGAHLVISAIRGLSGIKRMLLGTVVERMARTLSRPLLTVRPARTSKHPSPLPVFRTRRIVVGCDFLPSTDPALLCAQKLACRCGAALHLLHTIEAPLDVDEPGAPLSTYAQAQEAQQERLRERLGGLLRTAGGPPRVASAALMEGIPGEALSKYAAQVEADLIVVGVQPRGTIEKMLVGSTTEAVLRHAPCPVMTVPRKRVAAIDG